MPQGNKIRIAVIDGQGGGIGQTLISGLKKSYGSRIEVIALGTNAAATQLMLKAGADSAATGENAIVFNSGKVDIITGPMGIILANSMLGEYTPAMAEAVGGSSCEKVLIPVAKCRITIAGSTSIPIQALIDDAVTGIGILIDDFSTKFG